MKLPNPYTRFKAYIRLQNIRTHSNDRLTFTNSVWNAINQEKFTDLDRSKMLKDLNRRHEKVLSDKSEKLETEYLRTERANDYTKFAV